MNAIRQWRVSTSELSKIHLWLHYLHPKLQGSFESIRINHIHSVRTNIDGFAMNKLTLSRTYFINRVSKSISMPSRHPSVLAYIPSRNAVNHIYYCSISITSAASSMRVRYSALTANQMLFSMDLMAEWRWQKSAAYKAFIIGISRNADNRKR